MRRLLAYTALTVVLVGTPTASAVQTAGANSAADELITFEYETEADGASAPFGAYTVNPAGGSPTALLVEEGLWSAKWSPDRGSVAFLSNAGIWVGDSTGAARRLLCSRSCTGVSVRHERFSFRWHPTEPAIVFSTPSAIFRVDVRSGVRRALVRAFDIASFSVAPEGNRLVFAAQACEYLVLPADGTRISDKPAETALGFYAVNLRGRTPVAVKKTSITRGKIHTARYSGKGIAKLSMLSGRCGRYPVDSDVSWSKNGRKLGFVRVLNRATTYEVWTMGTNGMDKVRRYRAPRNVAIVGSLGWSPRSTEIALGTSDDRGHGALVAVSAQGPMKSRIVVRAPWGSAKNPDWR